MGIRFTCPNGHKLNVKEHLAGKRGICPNCGVKVVIPAASESNGDAVETLPAAGVANSGVPVLRTAPTSAPSVVISVLDSAVPPAQPPVALTPPPANLPPAPSPTPHAFDFAVAPATPAPPPASIYAVRRARGRRLQVQIAVLLFMAVIVLAIVLVWVLFRGQTEPTAPDQKATHLAPGMQPAYVADAGQISSTKSRGNQGSST